MKKTKKTPRVVLVVLITLLVVAGLFIFRSYILGTLGIGAAVTGETNLAVKYANTSGLLKDTLVNVSGGTDAATNQKYIGLNSSNSSATATTTSSATTTATAASTSSAVSTPTPSNGCTSPSTVKATITGSPFHLGLSKTVSGTNEINFGTKDQVLDSLTYASHGLWLSRQNTFLRVKSIPGNNTPLDVTIKFTGATLNNQSIKLVNKDPLETGDTYSVDTATNTATLHFTANNDDSDIDGVAIYFYCNGVSPASSSSVREGTISGTFDLGAVKNVTKFKAYSLTGSVNATCSKTDLTSSLSTDNVNWSNEKTSGSSDTVAYDQPIQARYVKYVITLRSCNQTDTPKVLSAAVVGPTTSATVTGSTSSTSGSSATTTTTASPTPSVFTWKGCVDGSADLQINTVDITILKYTYKPIGTHADCATKFNDTAPKGTSTGNLTGCLKVQLGANNSTGISLTQATVPFKVHINDNGTGPFDYNFTLNCIESVTPTPGPTSSSTSTSTESQTATTTSSIIEPPVPCDAERPITCSAPNPVATTTTTVQANGGICSLQTCVAGQSATPTVTTVSSLFNTPSGSAAGFLVNGIKSGLSFYLIIAGVLLISGVIIFRILKAE